MMFTIYALRIKGDTEVRYIGQTARLEGRFADHLSVASHMPRPTTFAEWLVGNDVEAVELASADTREDARRIEREMVAAFLALDHRLFNQWLVPSQKRQPLRERKAA